MKKNLSKILNAVFLVLLTTVASLFSFLPFVGAQQSIGRTVQTGAYLSVAPNPVGVGQQVQVYFWVEPIQPLYSVFHNYTLQITHPDGTIETQGPFSSLGQQTVQRLAYNPQAVGSYIFEFKYPGETFPSTNDTYLPSASKPVSLTVQAQPISEYPQSPLPTGYWTRPVNAENRNWSMISGNWLFMGYNNTQIGYGDSWGGFNPYTTAPLTAHVMWTQQMTMGGLVGGDNVGSFFSGATYDPYLTPPIVINGLAYYRTQTSYATSDNLNNLGFECVDLRTGQILWKNDTGNIDFGQVWNYAYSTSGQGTRAYLWGHTLTSNWDVYDAYTGRWLFGYTNASSINQWVWWPDAFMSGADGTIYAFLLDGLNGWLAQWNSTKAFMENQISISGPTPTYYDWSLGIQYNVTIPLHLVDSTTIYSTELTTVGAVRQGISGNVLLAKVTDGGNKVYYEIGYDINTGQELWVHGQNDSVQGFFTVMGNGVYASWDITTASWVGYDLNTGQKMWTTQPNVGWGDFVQYGDVIANGVLYAGDWGGHIDAIDIRNGNLLWRYYAGDAGTATPFGSWPFWGGVMVGGGVVFSGTGQESPSNPLFPGYRLYAINATSGQGIWNITGYFAVRAIADGYLLAYNSYDNKVYCFGKGPSATTISAPQAGVTVGSPVTITGTVTDQSTVQKSTPAMSDRDMSAWMEYLHMQKPKPQHAIGVPVTLTAISSDGSITTIGITTSDMYGSYGLSWIPQSTGTYHIVATFAGSDSYGESSASTYVTVGSSPPASLPQSSLDTFLLAGIIAIIVILIVATILLFRRK